MYKEVYKKFFKEFAKTTPPRVVFRYGKFWKRLPDIDNPLGWRLRKLEKLYDRTH